MDYLPVIGLVIGVSLIMPAVVSLAQEIRDLDRARARFEPMIRQAASNYNLSYHVLSSLLWIESRMDPGARGRLGEVGMGQMLSPAAADVGIDLSALSGNAELQIYKAAEYLRTLIDRAEGDIVLGLRAYNAGLARAKRDPVISMEYAGRVIGLGVLDMLIGGLA